MNPKLYASMMILAVALLGGCVTAAPIAAATQTMVVLTGVPASAEASPGLPTPTGTVAAMPLPSGTVVLAWHREGGIAGYCDDLKVDADGSFTVLNCVAIPGTQRSGQLDTDQLAQLTLWVNTFQSFAVTDGQRIIAPDAMIQKTAFTGTGAKPASAADRQAIDAFAAQLVSSPVPMDPGNNPQAILNARDYLARELNVPADEITVVSFGFVQWPDRCLGVVVLGEMCAQGITPGYQVILRGQTQLYELHTDEKGESIRQVR